jgi:2Fe-2S ferredoxin
MPQLNVTTREGKKYSLNVSSGLTVMEAIRDSGVDAMLALCGGVCSCATCHVHVDGAFLVQLPPMSTDEDELLDGSSHRTAESRLSCQIRMSDSLSGLSLTVAQDD